MDLNIKIDPCRECAAWGDCKQLCEKKIEFEDWSEACEHSQHEWREQRARNRHNRVDLDNISKDQLCPVSWGDVPIKQVFSRPLSPMESVLVCLIMAGWERRPIMKRLRISKSRYDGLLWRIRRKVINRGNAETEA